MSNIHLNYSKQYANDEWYTPYESIESELLHYIPQFHQKRVLCNCNDSKHSGFFKFFMNHFKSFGLKQLVCIPYGNDPITIVNDIQKHIEYPSYHSYQVTGRLMPLMEDGRFQSIESIQYLKNCDIVVTNPPFSQFIELFRLIMTHKKQFLLLANMHTIMYKDIFPYIKRNEIRLGYHKGNLMFKVPSGQYKRLGYATWLTNLQVIPPPFLELTQSYDNNYPQYDNFNAIHVNKVANIPKNYDGIMGVPVNFINKYNPQQFEIVGEANHGTDNEYDLFRPRLNGKETFKRILIRHKSL